jgi:terminase small subunit-like protein
MGHLLYLSDVSAHWWRGESGTYPSKDTILLDKLTERQHNFTLNYIKNGFNAYQAAMDAGYSPLFSRTRASTMINHPIILDQVTKAHQKMQVERMNELSITLADKAKMLMRIIEDIIPSDGSEPKRQYYKDALKAINELNKMAGHHAPDRKLSINVDTTKERMIEARKQYEEY